MSANIRVVCRFRPQNDRELKEGGKAIIQVIGDTVNIKGEESNHTFTFDRIYTDKSSQKEIFEDVAKPMIEDIFRGYNGTIFVYGQTSSGKTHTMMGPDGGKAIEDPNLKGLVPRIVVALFQSIQQASEDIEFLVKVSYVEIYMEKIRDLLDISKNNLAIREDKTKGIWLDGVSEVYVAEEKDVLEIMKQGTANRAIAPTKMNFESSRSHSLFIITIQQKDLKNLSNKTGKLYLVDLGNIIEFTHLLFSPSSHFFFFFSSLSWFRENFQNRS
jgi:kinesin family member 5